MRSGNIQISDKFCTFCLFDYLLLLQLDQTFLSPHPPRYPHSPFLFCFSSEKSRAPMHDYQSWHIKLQSKQTLPLLLRLYESTWQEERVPKAGSTVRDSSCFHQQESHKKTKLHNCNIQAKSLGQFQAGSLVVGSVS